MDWDETGHGRDARERRPARDEDKKRKKKEHGAQRKAEHRAARRESAPGDAESAGYRHGRLEKLLGDELRGLLGDELSDPDAEGVRVVRVELSVDYRHARVLLAVPERAGGALRALERATPWLRGRLGEALDTKVLPALRFALAGLEDAAEESEDR